MGNTCNCNHPNEFKEVNLETIRISRSRSHSYYDDEIESVETGILTDEEEEEE